MGGDDKVGGAGGGEIKDESAISGNISDIGNIWPHFLLHSNCNVTILVTGDYNSLAKIVMCLKYIFVVRLGDTV